MPFEDETFDYVEDEFSIEETLKQKAEGIKIVLDIFNEIERLQDRLDEIFYYEPDLYDAVEDYRNGGLAFDLYKDYIEKD